MFSNSWKECSVDIFKVKESKKILIPCIMFILFPLSPIFLILVCHFVIPLCLYSSPFSRRHSSDKQMSHDLYKNVQVSVRVLFNDVSRLTVKNNWQTLTVAAASLEESEILRFSADFLFLLVAKKFSQALGVELINIIVSLITATCCLVYR